jgi:putative thioredoxin
MLSRAMTARSEASPWVISVDAATFERDVLERSLSVPVVVDFWATWCGPCKTLGPLLEQRARDGAGRFLLAKVDVDRSPELAQAVRVQGIPTVIALAGGRLVDGFQGALPEPEIDAFLNRIAPPRASIEEERLARARQLAAEGDAQQAIALLRSHLRDHPAHETARLVLGDLLVDQGRMEEARLLHEKLSEQVRESAEGRALLTRIEFAARSESLADLEEAVRAAPGDAAARLALGQARVATKLYAPGLSELLEAYRLDPAGIGRAAKAAMLETFELLGLEDPVANEYRFKLSLELFA